MNTQTGKEENVNTIEESFNKTQAQVINPEVNKEIPDHLKLLKDYLIERKEKVLLVLLILGFSGLIVSNLNFNTY
jgi:hypothetical protein